MMNNNFNSYRSNYNQQRSYTLPEVVFFTPNGVMNPNIVDSIALAYARAFVEGQIKSSQLRKFYADAKALELKCKALSFTVVLAQIKLLKAKVEYAKARRLVPEEFKTWLSTCVDKVGNEGDFQAFLLHFEAVVGFCYGNGLKDNG